MLRLGTDSDTPNQSEHVRKSLKGSHPWSVAARLPPPAVQGLPEAQEAATDALTALAPAKGWDHVRRRWAWKRDWRQHCEQLTRSRTLMFECGVLDVTIGCKFRTLMSC